MLKKSLLAAAVTLGLSGLFAPPAVHSQEASCKLVVHVSGFRNAKGVAGATLFNKADGWPEDNDKSFKHGPFPIDPATRTATVTFADLAPGAYAFAVIHDENENKKLDRNLIGIPKEGFGFANNPHVALSAPSFKDASVNVQCPVTEINVALQYK